MPYKIGTDRISPEQRNFLEQARSARRSPDLLAAILGRVLKDDEITSGEETLHPEWSEIYHSNYGALPDSLKGLLLPPPQSPILSKIDPRKLRVCFLLGAGASKPEPSSIPTVKELLPDLLARARRLDREDVTKLANYCEESHITNIEDLLTAAQLSEYCARNRAVLGLVDFLLFREPAPEPSFLGRRRRAPVDVSSVALLQETLQILFGLLSSRMLPAPPNGAHQAIAAFVKEHANTSVITTNYDCCMDRALATAGLEFKYEVEFANTGPETGKIPLLKLHGSLNWFYCETCQHVFLIDIERTVKDYLDDRALYPVIGVCKDCGGQRRGLLVPPLAMKFDVPPPLNPLLDRAEAAFGEAELIAVVGFSFAEADLYLTRMLTKAMQNTTAQLLIVDPDFDVVTRVRKRFGIRIPNFHDERIVWAVGDCSEVLPKFLSGGLAEATMPAAPIEVAPNGSPSEVPR
jgi:NAD-dependent SIR2 family protein deacetylase